MSEPDWSNIRRRFFPLFRPEALLGDLGTGSMGPPTRETLRENARQVADNIENLFPKLGMVGMGEFIVGGFITRALDPIEIASDVAPIMEALRTKNYPIQFPTATSGWKGGLYYIYEPLWVDEVAARAIGGQSANGYGVIFASRAGCEY